MRGEGATRMAGRGEGAIRMDQVVCHAGNDAKARHGPEAPCEHCIHRTQYASMCLPCLREEDALCDALSPERVQV